MTAGLDLALIPPLGEARAHPVPAAHETTLSTGLHVVVVPRPGVPLVELRLRIPFAAPNAHLAAVHTARGSVLAGAVLLGTEAQLLRQADSVLGRTLAFAAAELIHGRAELAGELAARLAAVTPEQLRDAAGRLDPDTVAVLELRATGGRR